MQEFWKNSKYRNISLANEVCSTDVNIIGHIYFPPESDVLTSPF